LVSDGKASGTYNVNGGGNAYDASGSSATFNWNDHGSLTSGGTAPISVSSLATTMDALTSQLGSLTANGVVCQPIGSASCAPHPAGASNPSFLVLYGTSSTLNVFTLTAAQFAWGGALDIEVPAGSTVIINVTGTNATLPTGIYYRGVQETDANASSILFNFPQATGTVTINGQFDGALLAPYAMLTGGSQMGGTFIAASIGQTGEVHYDAFTGTLPASTVTPEPKSLLLLGTGILMVAVFMRKRIAIGA
jgi:choice-of-anchor A domain-containing protein